MNKYQKVKLVLLGIFSVGFLIIFYNYSQNSRFYLSNNKNIIIDSKTGNIYFPSTGTTIKIEDYKKVIPETKPEVLF